MKLHVYSVVLSKYLVSSTISCESLVASTLSYFDVIVELENVHCGWFFSLSTPSSGLCLLRSRCGDELWAKASFLNLKVNISTLPLYSFLYRLLRLNLFCLSGSLPIQVETRGRDGSTHQRLDFQVDFELERKKNIRQCRQGGNRGKVD